MKSIPLEKAMRFWVLVGFALLYSASCEKTSDLDARMSAVQGSYYLDAGVDTWHCPDGSIPDRLLDARLEKVGKTWIFEYQLPYWSGDGWTTFRICQPVCWDPLTGSYYFRPLTKDDLPSALTLEGIQTWSYSLQHHRIHILAGTINLNWNK